MKKLLSLIAVIMLFASLLAISSFANDYYVYSAYDFHDFISTKSPYSVNKDIITENNTIYTRIDVTANGTGGDGTSFDVNIAQLAKDFYVKDYPIVKFGYRSNAAASGAYVDLNLGIDYIDAPSRIWGYKFRYTKTGNDASYIFDLSKSGTGGDMGSGYTWNNVSDTSYVNYLRFKTYYNGQSYVKGEYFDIEYIAFFKTEADANDFDYDFDFSKGITEFYLKEQVRRVVKGNSINMRYAYKPSFVPSPVGVTYTSNNTSVARVDASTGKVTAVSAGTAVITATYDGMSSTCKVIVLDKEIAPVEFISRDEAAPAANVITSSLGDSITTYAPSPNRGKNYHDWWGEWFYVTNEDRGISGTRLAEANGYDENAFVNRYYLMRDDADIVTVKGGTNDWGSTSQGSSDDRTTTTYRGALRILMEGLIEKYPDRQIVFFTPIKRCEGRQTPDSVNRYGDTLNDYANAVLEIAADYDIPAINLYTPEELDFTSTVISSAGHDANGVWHDAVCEDDRMPDGLHPSGKGHITISEYMIMHMKKLGVIDVEGYDIVDEAVYGDADNNGVVESNDLVVISRYLAQWTGYNTINEKNSNLNGDNLVDSTDSVILARYLAKWSGYTTLPFAG